MWPSSKIERQNRLFTRQSACDYEGIHHCQEWTNAERVSGSSIFSAATHQESRIHVDSGVLAGAWNWRHHGGLQRDLRGATEPLSVSGPGPHSATDDYQQGGNGGLGESKRPTASATAATAHRRECAGNEFSAHDPHGT